MNRVGTGGQGESVWLGWFLLRTLADFMPHAEARGDEPRLLRWRERERALKVAIEACAWDGQWYRRATYDDGTPLGSRSSAECMIDSLPQSWSVLSDQGDPARSRTALDSALAELVDPDLRIVRLFTPPFSAGERDPGYIAAYPPGVRENGGQYTHAATWMVIALARTGRADEAYRLFDMLNPITHATDETAAQTYRVEPYVVAADVYSTGEKAGRGGWTWYTGSAGWLFRAGVEGILGIRREGGRLVVSPAIPSDWPGYAATLRLDGKSVRLVVRRGSGGITVDGRAAESIAIDKLQADSVVTVETTQ